MEIIVLPYMGISFLIAWSIFSPFAQIEDLREWTFAKIETGDLLAIFLPFSFLMALMKWAVPVGSIPVWAWSAITVTVLLISVSGLIAGLFILAKTGQKSSFKRMAIIGVIFPLGSMLVLAWIALPVCAFANSIFYAVPATLMVVPITLAMRWLSGWVLRDDLAVR